MKKPYELSFVEFANAAKPSGAVNRVPRLGGDQEEVLSYSVYMNGAVAEQLPAEALDHEYPDVTLHALTEKVGLDPKSFRDNLKVAELVATRSAWMSAILDATTFRDGNAPGLVLSDEVQREYALLTDAMNHPWIQEQLEAQRALSANLPPILKAAEEAVGRSVTDQIPEEITHGVIVAQNLDFTVQASGEGVVAHENRRLASMPSIGQDVTVLYYRGNGQVFSNTQELAVSAPFVDGITGDLAVSLMEGKKIQQVVLFNGVATFAKFVEQQGLDNRLVEQAIEARASSPKRSPEKVPEGAKVVTSGRFIGRVADVKDGYAVQGASPGVFVAHKLSELGRTPAVGEKLDVQYRDGKAAIQEAKAQTKELGGR